MCVCAWRGYFRAGLAVTAARSGLYGAWVAAGLTSNGLLFFWVGLVGEGGYSMRDVCTTLLCQNVS